MIKVSVMYPNAQGVSFDHDYYKTTHMPLVKSKMGKALQRFRKEDPTFRVFTDEETNEIHFFLLAGIRIMTPQKREFCGFC